MTKKTTVKKIGKSVAAKKRTNVNSKADANSTGRLKELQCQLEAVNATRGVIELKLDGAILSANEYALKTLGYSSEELTGRHHSFLLDEKTRHSGEYFDFWAKLNRAESQSGDYRWIGKNGREIWVEASYNPLLQNGKISKIVAYAKDITAEIVAKQAAGKLVRAVEKVSGAIMMVDRDLIVTYVNDTTKAMLVKNAEHFRALWPGFTPEKIIGTCIDVFHRNPAHQRGMLSDPRNLPIRTDISVGPLRFALCVNASYDAEGNYNGNILEWADVTEIRKQEALNADYAGQIAAIDANQAVVEFAMDGTIRHANQNFLTATGYRLDEIVGKHHSIFVDAAYRVTSEYRQFWEKLGRGEAESGQYRRLRRDGEDVWLQASYNPIKAHSGKFVKVVKYATDITAYKLQGQQVERVMAETARVMSAMASGDLRQSMEGNLEGEFGKLRDSVNGCVDHLRKMMGQIRHAMSTMTVSATEIATGNLDLSQRTEEQAASLATTAANMEEITGTVKRNADNAKEANVLAGAARMHAEKGGSVVNHAIIAMGAINDASKRIADIIGVIDDIAFQTNLLALNAAVEAARAGEQGRGFAVVAAEVRNLAQRSAGAAKEIKTLIKDSVGRVEEGSRLVNESGLTLEQIVTAAKKVSDIVGEIAAASIEQSIGIERVTEAVQQMDIAVQQNSALVEETSVASSMMDDQTRGMSSLIDFFKLSDDDRAFSAAPKKETAVKPKAFGRPHASTLKRPALSNTPLRERKEQGEIALAEEF